MAVRKESTPHVTKSMERIKRPEKDALREAIQFEHLQNDLQMQGRQGDAEHAEKPPCRKG